MLKDFCWSAVVFPPLVGGGVEGGEGGRGGGGGDKKSSKLCRGEGPLKDVVEIKA